MSEVSEARIKHKENKRAISFTFRLYRVAFDYKYTCFHTFVLIKCHIFKFSKIARNKEELNVKKYQESKIKRAKNIM